MKQILKKASKPKHFVDDAHDEFVIKDRRKTIHDRQKTQSLLLNYKLRKQSADLHCAYYPFITMKPVVAKKHKLTHHSNYDSISDLFKGHKISDNMQQAMGSSKLETKEKSSLMTVKTLSITQTTQVKNSSTGNNNSTQLHISKLLCAKCKGKHLCSLYPCVECSFLACCLEDIHKHVVDVHKALPAFVCPFCGLVYTKSFDLENHICGRHVTSYDALCDGRSEHTGVGISGNNEKSVSKKSLFHEKISSAENTSNFLWTYPVKKYFCNQSSKCPFTSISLLDMVQHEKEHLYNNFWLPYTLHVCTLCGFQSKLQAVTSHVIHAHAEVEEENIDKFISSTLFENGRVWYFCVKCEMLFVNIHSISKHLDLKHSVPGFDPSPNTPQMKATLAEQWEKHVSEIPNSQWTLVHENEEKLFMQPQVCLNDLMKDDLITSSLNCADYDSEFELL